MNIYLLVLGCYISFFLDGVFNGTPNLLLVLLNENTYNHSYLDIYNIYQYTIISQIISSLLQSIAIYEFGPKLPLLLNLIFICLGSIIFGFTDPIVYDGRTFGYVFFGIGVNGIHICLLSSLLYLDISWKSQKIILSSFIACYGFASIIFYLYYLLSSGLSSLIFFKYYSILPAIGFLAALFWPKLDQSDNPKWIHICRYLISKDYYLFNIYNIIVYYWLTFYSLSITDRIGILYSGYSLLITPILFVVFTVIISYFINKDSNYYILFLIQNSLLILWTALILVPQISPIPYIVLLLYQILWPLYHLLYYYYIIENKMFTIIIGINIAMNLGLSISQPYLLELCINNDFWIANSIQIISLLLCSIGCLKWITR